MIRDYDLVTDDGRRWTYDVDDDGYWRSEDPDYPDVPDWAFEVTLKLHHGAREIRRGQHIPRAGDTP